MARDERDDAYGGGAYGGGAYGGGDYGRGDRDARTRDAHTHQNRDFDYDHLSARSRLTPTSTTPPRPTTAPDASSASYSLNIGIHDRSDDAPWLYHPPILDRGSTPSAWASAHRDVVPPTLASALHPVDERAVERVGEGIEQLGLQAAAARYQDAVVGVVPVWEPSLRWKNIALAVFEARADVDKVELPLDGAFAPTTVRCNHLYEPIMVRGEWVFHQRTTAHSNDQWTRHLFSLVYGEPARTTAN